MTQRIDDLVERKRRRKLAGAEGIPQKKREAFEQLLDAKAAGYQRLVESCGGDARAATA